MIGEETGRKVTPVEVATRIRSLRYETGNRRVADSPANYELLREISCNERKTPAAIACLEEEDAEAVVERSSRYNLHQRIKNRLTSL